MAEGLDLARWQCYSFNITATAQKSRPLSPLTSALPTFS